ncbi:hypothetical protein MC885_014791, partial [Smutsia gigantea]
MVQANPDASLRSRRPWRREMRLVVDSGFGNPFFQENVPEAQLHCGAHSALGTVSCDGDGDGDGGLQASPTEAGNHDLGRLYPRVPLALEPRSMEPQSLLSKGTRSPGPCRPCHPSYQGAQVL